MYGYNSYNNNYQYRPPKKGNRILVYIAIVLITSLVSGYAVGSYYMISFPGKSEGGRLVTNDEETTGNSLEQDVPEMPQSRYGCRISGEQGSKPSALQDIITRIL